VVLKTKEPPRLLPGLGHFYRAWWELDTERVISEPMIGPIPWSAIRRYGEAIGYSGTDLVYFTDVMRRVDIKHRSKVAEALTKPKTLAQPNLPKVPNADDKRSQKRAANRAGRRNARG
jgi:hypothetical protein